MGKSSDLAVHDVHDGVHDVHDTIQWLESVRKLDELVTAKMAEKQQVWDMLTKVTPDISGMPHGGGVSDKVGDGVAKLVDLEKEIDSAIDRYVDMKREVVKVLEQLPVMEYGALHRHYIQYMTWEEVAADMDRSIMQVWRYRTSALKKIRR